MEPKIIKSAKGFPVEYGSRSNSYKFNLLEEIDNTPSEDNNFFEEKSKISLESFIVNKDFGIDTISKGFLVGKISHSQENIEDVIIVSEEFQKRDKYLLSKFLNSRVKILKFSKKKFLVVVEQLTSKTSLFFASNNMILHRPESNAFIVQKFKLHIILMIIIFVYFIHTELVTLLFFANILFLIQKIHKWWIFLIVLFNSKKKNHISCQAHNAEIAEHDLPIYTILIPLFREAAKVNNITNAINNLNYPKEKLDVKLIVESQDTQTIKAIQILDLPDYFHIIKVPYSFPQTKPKACNYALNYSLGEYCVIYDAEDTPEPNQLLKVLKQFNELGENYVCLQAVLKIIPKKNSLISIFYKYEYKIWFEYFLKGLALTKMPITLGGTSNHFKTKILKKIGGWDAYNVTEDADIGIRFNLAGLGVSTVDSYTAEECSHTLKSWMKQRTRWIKGFIITFISYLKSDKSKQSYGEITSIVIFLGCATLSFMLLPIIIFAYNTDEVYAVNSLNNLILLNLIIYLMFLWCIGYVIVSSQSYKHLLVTYILIILLPFYFFLHSIASFVALIETIASPFRWNKTDHVF